MDRKIKVLVTALMLFGAVFSFELKAQCNFNVISDEQCNNDGEIEIVFDPSFTAPYTVDITYPDGSTATDNNIFDNPYIIDGLGAGEYDFVVSGSGLGEQCTGSAIEVLSLGITTNIFISSSFGNSGFDISCNGVNDGSATVSVFGGGGGPYFIEWFEGSAANPSFADTTVGNINNGTDTQDSLLAGTYVIQITSRTGCQTQKIITLDEPTLLSATSENMNVMCNGASTGSIDLNPSGGVIGTYTFDWTGPNSFTENTEDISGLSAGNYTVLITDANGCDSSFTIPITEPPTQVSISEVLASHIDVNCHGEATGSLEVTGSGGTPPYQFRINGGAWQASGVFPGLIAGQYNVEILDDNQCLDNILIDINQNTLITFSEDYHIDIICAGSLGSFDLIAQGGAGGFSYSFNGISQPTGEYTDLLAGNYLISATDNLFCSRDTTIIITEDAELLIQGTGNDASCFGASDGEITIQVNGGTPPYEYSLDGVIFPGNLGVFPNLVAGSYDVHVEDDNDCPADITIIVGQPTEIDIVLDEAVTDVSCATFTNGAIEVSVSGGTDPYNFSWIGTNSFTANTEDISGLSAGNYTLVVTDANVPSCSSSPFTVTVNQPGALVVAPINQVDVACNGGDSGLLEVAGSGGTPPYTYQWSGGSTSAGSLIEDLIAGDYTITITDEEGCPSSPLTITINEPAALSATLTPSFINCYGDQNGQISGVITGGTSPYTIAWDPSSGQSSLNFDNFSYTDLIANEYFATITDDNGCEYLDSAEVFQNQEITATFNITPETCQNDNGSLTVNVLGGIAPYTYSWGGIGQTNNPAVNLDGGFTYNVTVTDDLGCTSAFSSFLNEIVPVFIDKVTPSDALCFGESSGEIEVDILGGSSDYIFTLSPGGITVTSGSLDTVIGNIPAGSYTLQVEDNDGCTDIWNNPIEIDEPTPLGVAINTNYTIDQLACNGDNNGEIFLNINGGTPFSGGYYWLFVNDPTFSQQITTDSIAGLSAGTYDLTVQDANGCLASISHDVTEPDLVNVSVVTSDVECNNGDSGYAIVTIEGGTANYTLNSIPATNIIQLSTVDSFKLENLTSGAYLIDVIDAQNCSNSNSSASFYINEPAILEVINTSSTLESCLGWDATASVLVEGGTGPYNYIWTYDIDENNPVNLLNGVFNTTSWTSNPSSLNQGWYYVHVYDYYDCYVVDSVEVSIATNPELSLIGTVDNECYLDEEGQVSLYATGGNPYYEYSINGGADWYDIPTFSNLAEGSYTVMLRDSLGCTDEIEDIEIFEPAEIVATTNTTSVSCYDSQDGQSQVISVIGGVSSGGTYNYMWQDSLGVNLWPANPSAITSSINSLLPGQYQVVVEDDNECTGTAIVYITQPAQIGVDLSVISDFNGVQISCHGESDGELMADGLGGTPPFTFIWTDAFGNMLANDIAASVDTLGLVPAGDYFITVEDDNGCIASDAVSISQPEPISIDFENVIHIRCAGEEEGQATVTWSGGLGFGAYNITWTDTSSNFLWANATIDELGIGSYIATISDNNGCSHRDTVEINESEILNVLNGGDTVSISCFGMSDGALDLNPTGGWAPYDHYWSDNLNQQSQQAIGLSPGQWYVDIITDANGCVIIDSMYVESPLSPMSVNAIISDVNCFGDNSGSITIQSTGGTPNYTYSWTGPSSFSSVLDNISELEAGAYNLTVTDDHDCEYFETYEVQEPNSPLQISSVTTTNVLCHGEATGTAELDGNVSGGTGAPYPIGYDDWGGENPNELSAGTYTVIATDANGCVASMEYIIYEPEALEFSIFETTNENCEDENGRIVVDVDGGVLFGDGSYNYSLSPDYLSSNSNNPDISVDFPNPGENADTIFTLTVTDANGCVLQRENIELHSARVFDYNASMDVCFRDSVIVNAKYGDYTDYVWDIFPEHVGYDAINTFGYLANDTAIVSVTVTNNGCTFTDQFQINVKYPDVYAGEDVGIVRGEASLLSVSGDPLYMWSTGEANQTIEVNPLVTTYYVAEALDPLTQCVGMDTVRVFVGMNEGFSPNNDGFNDTWEIDYLNQYEPLHIDVYNRWGTILWGADAPNIENWDGKYNGEDLPVGTYYYVITFSDNLKEPLTGPVTIVR